MTYMLGLLLVFRLKVGLDRTLKLALAVTGVALLLKMVYNIILFATDASRQTDLPIILEIILWNTQNKSISLINFVFLILFARSVSIITAF